MRHEHKSHVLVISLMLMFILVAFGWAIYNHSSGFGANERGGITTSLPYAPVVVEVDEDSSNVSAVQTEISVLIGLSVILAFLFAVYLVMRIVREFKHLK